MASAIDKLIRTFEESTPNRKQRLDLLHVIEDLVDLFQQRDEYQAKIEELRKMIPPQI